MAAGLEEKSERASNDAKGRDKDGSEYEGEYEGEGRRKRTRSRACSRSSKQMQHSADRSSVLRGGTAPGRR
eukprot:730692-Hanusia_phi.AAC.1